MKVHTKSRLSVLLVTAVLLVSAIAMPAMAAITYDSETTDTASTSDLLNGDTVTDLDNSSVVKTIEVQSDNATSGDDFTLKVAVNDSESDQDGEVIYETNDSWTATNETAGYYRYNVTHSDMFETLERDAGQNVTLDVTTTVNASTNSSESETIQIHAQNDEDSAVAAVYGDEDGTELANETGMFSLSMDSIPFFGNDSDSEDTFSGAAKSTETVSVNASNTTDVRVELLNSSTAAAGENALGETDAGSFLGVASASVDGELVPMFSESAEDVSWIDTSSDTYATIDSEGDTVTYHNVNEAVDSDGEVDVTTTLNDGIGFNSARKMLSGYGDLGIMKQMGLAWDANNINGDAFGDGLF